MDLRLDVFDLAALHVLLENSEGSSMLRERVRNMLEDLANNAAKGLRVDQLEQKVSTLRTDALLKEQRQCAVNAGVINRLREAVGAPDLATAQAAASRALQMLGVEDPTPAETLTEDETGRLDGSPASYIQTIKAVRERTCLGLREAKDLVDTFCQSLNKNDPRYREAPPGTYKL